MTPTAKKVGVYHSTIILFRVNHFYFRKIFYTFRLNLKF